MPLHKRTHTMKKNMQHVSTNYCMFVWWSVSCKHSLYLWCPTHSVLQYWTILLRINYEYFEHYYTLANITKIQSYGMFPTNEWSKEDYDHHILSSECVFYLQWNLKQGAYRNNPYQILGYYSRNHRFWPSICCRIPYITVKCAWMLKDTTCYQLLLISGK
jgi:hypothetical protein